eukprot:1160178-Pelagomonas_calceolata.AAC.10
MHSTNSWTSRIIHLFSKGAYSCVLHNEVLNCLERGYVMLHNGGRVWKYHGRPPNVKAKDKTVCCIDGKARDKDRVKEAELSQSACKEQGGCWHGLSHCSAFNMQGMKLATAQHGLMQGMD